jgi:hypothetical protein
VPPQLRQEVPHHLHHRLRTSAGSGVTFMNHFQPEFPYKTLNYKEVYKCCFFVLALYVHI